MTDRIGLAIDLADLYGKGDLNGGLDREGDLNGGRELGSSNHEGNLKKSRVGIG